MSKKKSASSAHTKTQPKKPKGDGIRRSMGGRVWKANINGGVWAFEENKGAGGGVDISTDCGEQVALSLRSVKIIMLILSELTAVTENKP